MAKTEKRKAEAKEHKLREITPTLKQKIAFKRLVEIGRNPAGRKSITIGKILKEAGYSLAIQVAPTKVTQSKGWQKLMEEYYPDDDLANAEKTQLHASTIGHYVFPEKESDEEIREIIESFPNCVLVKIRKQHTWKRAYFYAPDNTAIGKSLDRIYKLKNKYPAQKQKIEGKVEIVELVDYRTGKPYGTEEKD